MSCQVVAVQRPDHREPAVHGIGHREAFRRRPESEAVVEAVRVLVLELERPGLSPVLRLVDARIRSDSGRKEISDLGADPLDVAELQGLGSRNHLRDPGVSAVRRECPGSVHAARPDHLGVDRADRLKPAHGSTVLRRESGSHCLPRGTQNHAREQQAGDADSDPPRDFPPSSVHDSSLTVKPGRPARCERATPRKDSGSSLSPGKGTGHAQVLLHVASLGGWGELDHGTSPFAAILWSARDLSSLRGVGQTASGNAVHATIAGHLHVGLRGSVPAPQLGTAPP